MRPFFMEIEGGYRFIAHYPPSGPGRSPSVVYVPPFTEEMNKCRHMAAVAGRAMAARGHAVLVPDLAGCGDSSGQLDQISWNDWRDDIVRAVDWLRDASGGRVVLWGVRLGALLAATVARDFPDRIERLLLWQPQISGDIAISQFLRLKIAGEMLSASSASTGLAEARAALAAGATIEIAGYRLSPDLADAIASQRLANQLPPCPVHWLEVASDPAKGVSQASLRVVDEWRARGVEVDASVVHGPPFWTSGSNEDVVDCLPLLDATDSATGSW